MKFCRGCGRPVTGQQVLAALARMIEQGLTAQEATATMVTTRLTQPTTDRGSGTRPTRCGRRCAMLARR